MKKFEFKWVYFILAIMLHAFLTLASFTILNSIRDIVSNNLVWIMKGILGMIMVSILLQPTLWFMSEINISGFALWNVFPWRLILTLVNSTIAISIIYFFIKWMKRKVATIWMKKPLFNIICGLATGFIYGLESCKLLGLINSLLFFSVLGLLYGYIVIVIDLLTRKFYNPLKVIIRPPIKGAIVFYGLASIFEIIVRWGRGYGLIYAIFQYKESDPLGPALGNIFFSLFLGISVLIINLVTEVYAVIKNKPTHSTIPK